MSDDEPQDTASNAVVEDSTAELGARCIAVQVRGGLYGVRMEDVQEVIALSPLTRVFHAPPAMAGVTSLRGEILPVLDLAILLGAGEATPRTSVEARVVVVREATGLKRRAGLLIDELRGIRDLPEDGLDPVPTTVSSSAGEIVVGVVPESPPCSMLSVSKIFASSELAGLAQSSRAPDTSQP